MALPLVPTPAPPFLCLSPSSECSSSSSECDFFCDLKGQRCLFDSQSKAQPTALLCEGITQPRPPRQIITPLELTNSNDISFNKRHVVLFKLPKTLTTRSIKA